MRIIKVDAIESTNTFLRDLIRSTSVEAFTTVSAREQTAGRGQMGTIWKSKAGENLTCSVFVPMKGFALSSQFYISMAVALAISKTLQSLLIPKIKIKWPNDILSDKQKVCGILIENIVAHGQLTGVIVGIGLNVNQIDFEGLPQASSLKLITGKFFNIDELTMVMLDNLKKYIELLTANEFDALHKAYEALLFRKNKPSTFQDVKGESFVGIICNVSPSGKLNVLLEDEIVQEFDLKQIKLRY